MIRDFRLAYRLRGFEHRSGANHSLQGMNEFLSGFPPLRVWRDVAGQLEIAVHVRYVVKPLVDLRAAEHFQTQRLQQCRGISVPDGRKCVHQPPGLFKGQFRLPIVDLAPHHGWGTILSLDKSCGWVLQARYRIETDLDSAAASGHQRGTGSPFTTTVLP